MKSTDQTLRNYTAIILTSLLGIIFTNCSSEEVPADPNTTENGIEVLDGTNAELHVDNGSIGVVIDTREIYRKGYLAETARIQFQDFSKFDSNLEIDPFSNMAILSIENDSLTMGEKNAFASGVQATITIEDDSKNAVSTYAKENLVLDDSNFPVTLQTSLPNLIRPLILKSESPYLLQMDGMDGIITSHYADTYEPLNYDIDLYGAKQQYFFISTGETNVFRIQHTGYDQGSMMFVAHDPSIGDFISLSGATLPLPTEGPAEFLFEQDEEGWYKIRLNNTSGYVTLSDDFLKIDYEGNFDRFRLISDNINWSATDQGTTFLQPIKPPAKLDFAYEATLKNCSSALLTEEVGKSESRTRTTTFSSTESIELFSSEAVTAGLKVGVEVGAKVGGEVYGGSAEVKASAEASVELALTTSETTTSTNTIGGSDSYTSEVSRIRTLQLDPYSGVEVYDAIKSVENIITPFVQTIRITGSYKNGTKEALTGPELATQMQFNFVGGIVNRVGSDYIDLTVRGQAVMNQMFEASTEVNELHGTCDN